jgi:isocitrate dehydrogenase (NAD+)
MAHRATLLVAGGATQAADVIESINQVGPRIDWDVQDISPVTDGPDGARVPKAAVDSIRATKVALDGTIGRERGADLAPVDALLRSELDLFANLRHAKTDPGRPGLYRDVDLVVIRETSEDQFTTIEFDARTSSASTMRAAIAASGRPAIREDAAVAVRAMSEYASRRVARFTFEYARKNSRRKVTAVHKANIIKSVDGLFLRVLREVARDYPEIEFEDRIIDNMCMQLVKRPEDYDVLVAPNLYGDLLVGVVAGIVGGPDVAASGAFGEEVAVFKSTSWTGSQGENRRTTLNGLMLAAGMLLRHIGEVAAGERLEEAIAAG